MKSLRNTIVIEDFLKDFKPKNLGKKLKIVDSSSENEEELVKKPKKTKKKLIIESSSSTISKNDSSPEIVIKRAKTKKTKLVGIKPKTKKNIKS
jgi:hypothetical protein